MADDIGTFFKQQEDRSERQRFYIVMENARNTMRAVRIMVQEGEYDEAIAAIDEALGESQSNG